MVDGKVYPIYADMMYDSDGSDTNKHTNGSPSQGKSENEANAPNGNGTVDVETKKPKKPAYRERTMSVDELMASSRNLHQFGMVKEQIQPTAKESINNNNESINDEADQETPSGNGGGAVHETEEDASNDDNTKPINRKSPYHHSHQISYEDMSRSMSAMWAGCTMIETEDTDDDDARKADKMRRKSFGKSTRRSKSVDFDNVSGVVEKDTGSTDTQHTVKNRSSSTLQKKTHGHDRTESTRDTQSSSSSSSQQQHFPTTVDQFMSDARATVSLRKRLKRMLQRRDEAARKVNEMLSSPLFTSEEKQEPDAFAEGGTSDYRLLRKEAEVLREKIRTRKMSLAVRRTDVE